MKGFEELLREHRSSVERFVRFRISGTADADDVLQNTYIAAYRKFEQLRNPASFKAWVLSIARNQCNDYFRDQAKRMEIPLDEVSETVLSYGRHGKTTGTAVSDTLELLGGRERQILYLSYWKQMPQAEIAKSLNIPLGTVKSRLHTAKQRFKSLYPMGSSHTKGDTSMTKLPEILPDYTITPSELPPFPVVWEETMGWLIVPRMGERLSWGLYDYPSRRRTEYTDMEVVGKAEVHGIEGVEIVAVQHDAEDYYRTGSINEIERRFIAQLTDTHCRYLAETHEENGVRKFFTFLDGDSFISNWGFGEDNCGKAIHMTPKGHITRSGTTITAPEHGEILDVVGRYTVTIGEKTYDTVCIMDCETFDDAVATEQFVDQNGRTVLWRRFNRDDWAIDRFGGKLWSEKLPDNERLTINGSTYVHWYDCISDYIL